MCAELLDQLLEDAEVRASNPGKQDYNRQCIRGPADPTGEKDANSSDKEDASGERPQDMNGTSMRTRSASTPQRLWL